jgi:hypothetical protein
MKTPFYFLFCTLIISLLNNESLYSEVSCSAITNIQALINDYEERGSTIQNETIERLLANDELSNNERTILFNYINHLTRSFGGWAIDEEVLEAIKTLIKPGSTVLELGSGDGTFELLKLYKVFSIEHDQKWVNKYESTYIYAPIKNNWYDIEIVKKELPEHYDLILVDGPPGNIGRHGFFTNLELFNTSVPIIFDDVNRKPEYELMVAVAKQLKKTFTVFSSKKKQFGIVQ